MDDSGATGRTGPGGPVPARYGTVGRGVEPMDWMVLVLVTAVFLAYSAAMWLLVIKHADTQPGARGAGQQSPDRAAVAPGTDEPVATGQQAA